MVCMPHVDDLKLCWKPLGPENRSLAVHAWPLLREAPTALIIHGVYETYLVAGIIILNVSFAAGRILTPVCPTNQGVFPYPTH